MPLLTYRNIQIVTLKMGKKRYRASIKNPTTNRMQRLGSFHTLLEAQIAINQAKADISRGKGMLVHGRSPRLAQALTDYLHDISWHHSYRSDRVLAHRWITDLGRIRLHLITPGQITALRTKWRATGMSPSRCNRYTDWLRTFFNVKLREGLLVANPLHRLSRFPEPEAPIYFYTDEQERRLLDALAPNHRLWVRLAILTGLRRKNLFGMRKEWINWEDGLITIPETKNRRARYRPMTPEVHAILQTLCAHHPESPFVFPSPRFKDRPMDPQAWMRKVFTPACQVANVPTHLKWHSLKHTTGSRLIKAGYTARQIQLALDHSSLRATERYTHMLGSDMTSMLSALSPGYILATHSQCREKPQSKALKRKGK